MEERISEAADHEGDNSNVALHSSSAGNSTNEMIRPTYSHPNTDDKTNFNQITLRVSTMHFDWV